MKLYSDSLTQHLTYFRRRPVPNFELRIGYSDVLQGVLQPFTWNAY